MDAVFIAVNIGLPFVIAIAGDNEMAEAVTAEHPRLLFGLNVDAVANAALTGWRTVSGNENLKLRIAKRAVAHVPMTWRCVLTISSVIHSGRRVPMRVGANGLDSPSPQRRRSCQSTNSAQWSSSYGVQE